MVLEAETSSPDFPFIAGWPPSRRSYSGAIRAHVLRKHLASGKARIRRKKNQEQRLDDREEAVQTYMLQTPAIHSEVAEAGSSIPKQSLTWNFFGQGSADPFHSLARPITNFEKHMIEIYAQGAYPWQSRTIPQPKFRPSPQMFLPLNIRTELVMDVMIYYGAISLAKRHSSPQVAVTAAKQKQKVIAGIRQQIVQSQFRYSANLVLALLGSLCCELETGDWMKLDAEGASTVKAHAQGLRYLLRTYTEWDALKRDSPATSWLCIWVDAQISGSILGRLPQSPTIFAGCGSICHAHHLTHEIFTNMQELFHWYSQFYANATSRYRSSLAVYQAALSLEPIWLFQPPTAAYQVLRNKEVVRVPRLVHLFYVNLLLHKCMNMSCEEKAVQYHRYHRNFVEAGVEEMPTCVPLLWGLMTDMKDRTVSDYEVIECTLRLMRLCSSLAREVEVRLGDTLCDFILMFQEEAVIGSNAWWTPTEFSALDFGDPD